MPKRIWWKCVYCFQLSPAATAKQSVKVYINFLCIFVIHGLFHKLLHAPTHVKMPLSTLRAFRKLVWVDGVSKAEVVERVQSTCLPCVRQVFTLSPLGKGDSIKGPSTNNQC